MPRDTGVSWDSCYALLLSFVSRTGHARVPERHVEDGVRLGHWVRSQRRIYSRGRLPHERLRRLEAIQDGQVFLEATAADAMQDKTLDAQVDDEGHVFLLRCGSSRVLICPALVGVLPGQPIPTGGVALSDRNVSTPLHTCEASPVDELGTPSTLTC